jgi:precorrin-2 dehydrogenase/sirohydrochlorin ferrochelatase
MNDKLFAAIDISGRPCVIIGGGEVAERKARKLVKCGAVVTAISPYFTLGLEEMAKSGLVSLMTKCYKKGDLSGTFLAVIATDDDDANMAALMEAKELRVLTNAAFDKKYGNIFFTATRHFSDYNISVLSDELSAKDSVDFLDSIIERLIS